MGNNTFNFNIERSREILKMINNKKRVTVTEIERYFNISGSTARRLLNELEKDGKLLRTHGGAVSVETEAAEDGVDNKRQKNITEKATIAYEARKLIKDGDIIMLGGGTTVFELARLLHDLSNSVIITDSIIVAAELYKNVNIEVQVIGGIIRPVSGVIIGHAAVKSLKYIFVDKAFIGADSISIEYGITTPNAFEAEIEAALMAQAKEVYLLADSSKFGKVTLSSQAGLEKIAHIITDNRADTAFIDKLTQMGIKVTAVKSKP